MNAKNFGLKGALVMVLAFSVSCASYSNNNQTKSEQKPEKEFQSRNQKSAQQARFTRPHWDNI